MSFTKLPATAKTAPTPFQVAVPDSAIQELRTLLELARVAPPTYESLRSDRKFGVTTEWIKSAKAEWESFDWTLSRVVPGVTSRSSPPVAARAFMRSKGREFT
ncbi:hypothetical protein B0H17DRAFT_1187169 [Mycena rosella]|uniref:Epoxide hydrolase N-terminal domain-containing protein n=1 Tax=Mycena rosella TaxID=1033263 RepID=A0AAD7FVL7_MYCRO|nr:hypothetical protein B0H17DRAFT_1187169 [Mycena rosella]